jgi:hypothetical protein
MVFLLVEIAPLVSLETSQVFLHVPPVNSVPSPLVVLRFARYVQSQGLVTLPA